MHAAINRSIPMKANYQLKIRDQQLRKNVQAHTISKPIRFFL